MEDIFHFNSGKEAVPERVWKGDKVSWRSSMGDTPRKGLVDITNLQQKPRGSNPSERSQFISGPAEEQIDQLLKEKMALMKQIADRNKIIELSAVELQKLRVNFQKAQLQNFHLAQANSQMLAELNAGKEKLKELRHELGCVKSLLTFKDLELEDKKKAKVHQRTGDEMQTTKCKEVRESSDADNHNDKPCSSKSKRLSKVAVASTFKDAVTTEKAENRRRSLRRQSSGFKTEKQESTEDLFEIDDTKFPVCPQLDDGKSSDVSTPLASTILGNHTENTNTDGSSAHEIRRSSLGRPLRQAAGKIQSYKEMSLKKKMRREV
ncbi:hypothetical protein Ancab_001308 [Ancistrocladus abbreviatus]